MADRGAARGASARRLRRPGRRRGCGRHGRDVAAGSRRTQGQRAGARGRLRRRDEPGHPTEPLRRPSGRPSVGAVRAGRSAGGALRRHRAPAPRLPTQLRRPGCPASAGRSARDGLRGERLAAPPADARVHAAAACWRHGRRCRLEAALRGRSRRGAFPRCAGHRVADRSRAVRTIRIRRSAFSTSTRRCSGSGPWKTSRPGRPQGGRTAADSPTSFVSNSLRSSKIPSRHCHLLPGRHASRLARSRRNNSDREWRGQHVELWLGVPVAVWLGGALALYMAWSIGANDVANAMGTSVGSGALTIRRAIIVAARARVQRRLPGRRTRHRHGAQGHARHDRGRRASRPAGLRHAGRARVGRHAAARRDAFRAARIDDALDRRRHRRLRGGGAGRRCGGLGQGHADRPLVGHVAAASEACSRS